MERALVVLVVMVARSVFVTRTPESGLATISCYTTHVLALVNKRLRIATTMVVVQLNHYHYDYCQVPVSRLGYSGRALLVTSLTARC